MTGLSADLLPGPSGLWEGERLLLAGLRAWAHCRRDRQPPQKHVGEALAAVASPRIGSLFAAMMMSLEAASRRPMRVHCGACPGYADDEQRLVLACGLATAAPEAASRLLSTLVNDPEPVACLARALNAAMAVDGYALPFRLYDDVGPSPTFH